MSRDDEGSVWVMAAIQGIWLLVSWALMPSFIGTQIVSLPVQVLVVMAFTLTPVWVVLLAVVVSKWRER